MSLYVTSTKSNPFLTVSCQLPNTSFVFTKNCTALPALIFEDTPTKDRTDLSLSVGVVG